MDSAASVIDSVKRLIMTRRLSVSHKAASDKSDFMQILLTILVAILFSTVFQISYVIFGILILVLFIIALAWLHPKILILSVLFTSSFIGFLIPKITFFSGTQFNINFDGLRNLLIIAVCLPWIGFNYKIVKQNIFFKSIAVYFFLFTLTTVINFSIDNLRFYTQVISPILFYFLIGILMIDERYKKYTFYAILGSSFIPIVVSFLQSLHLLPEPENNLNYVEGTRIASTFDNGNTFSIYLVGFSVISIYYLIKQKSLFLKLRNFIYFACMHISLFLTHSRNAIVAISLAYMLILKAKYSTIRAILIGIVLISLLLLIPGLNNRLLMPSIQNKTSLVDIVTHMDMETLDRYSMTRITIWRGWLMRIGESSLREHILGHGYDKKEVDHYVAFHNEILKTYWINGCVCCISFIFMMINISFRLFQWLQKSFRNNMSNVFYISAFAYSFATCFMANFDNTLGKYELFIYYFALISLAEITKRRQLICEVADG